MPIDPRDVLLANRVAVVTGGGSGIGRAIAAGLAAFGARVAVWEQDDDACHAAASEIDGLAVTTDVRDAEQVEGALARTIEELGVPSILVNNAGGVFWKPFLESTENGWDALHRANLKHVLLCTHRVAAAIVEAGTTGSVVNITSIEGVRGAPGYAAYAAAKAGVVSFTKSVAVELAPHGIRVNALAPDLTLTEGLEAVAPPGTLEKAGGMIPLGRAGHVDEMAAAAVFLASSMSSYITGQTIHVDGGTHAAGGWYRQPDGPGWVLGPR